MRRFLPRTLISQMILILLAGLVMSHLVAGWIYASDRMRVVRVVGGQAFAQRIANLVRLIDEAPDEWRPRIIAAMGDPRLRIAITAEPPGLPPEAVDAGDLPVRDYLDDLLPPILGETLRVSILHPHEMAGETRHGRPQHAMMPKHWRRMIVTVRLSDSHWLSLTMGVPETPPQLPWAFVAAMAAMAAIVVLASLWAVRRVTAPLGVVTRAARRFGRDVNAPPIAETGTLEMREVAQAFNEMQARLQATLRNRTTMLGALSHDLRTPLTLLRLRIETMPDSEDRARMLASVDTLEAMVTATLAYARDSMSVEPWRRTDTGALVESIVDDMADAGMPVTLVTAEGQVLPCQPTSLRRAITNLLDNAVKYGTRARVMVDGTRDGVRITIDDDGPGIPAEDRDRVFEPFFRLEPSRSRESGGTGLGLAIARAVAETHGGRIVLANRPEGGLRATLELPSRAD